MTFALALASVKAFRQRGERKAELGEELPLCGLAGPQVGAMRGGGIDQRAHRLRWQLHLLFYRCQLLIKLGNTCGSLFFLSGNAAELRQQRLPALVVVVDDKRGGDGGELVIQCQRRIPAGGANQDQIRHLCSDRFRAGFADIKASDVARFRHISPLAQEPLGVGHAVVRRGGAAGDHRRVNGQQRTGEGYAGRDNARRFVFQRVYAAAVGNLARPVGGLG